MPADGLARAYVRVLARWRRGVVAAAAVATALALVVIAVALPIRADFSYLLPDDAPAIRDLRALEARMPAHDTTLVVVVAPDPASRAAAAARLLAGLRDIGPELVARIEADDDAMRAVVRRHRWLYAPLRELTALREQLTGGARDLALAAVRATAAAGDAELARSRFVSADGTKQLVIVRMAFRATDVPADRALLAQIDAAIARARAAVPEVEIGVTGGAPSAVAEHDAVARGMVLSAAATALLVGIVLLVHLRRVARVAVVAAQIVVATIASFGLAALSVGHLNAATAFLGAVIAGNGINYGILLAARYAEEAPGEDGLARAIAATARPTLVASLGAAIAYGALAFTRFRGFADFAWIGGLGMPVCWIVAYTLLPALLLGQRGGGGTRGFGAVAERLAALDRPRLVRVAAVAMALAAGVVAWRFVASDPFEYDLTRLRSDSPAATRALDWLATANAAFGRVLGRTYAGVDHVEQVPALVDAIRAARATPDGAATIGRIESVLDLVPPDQPAKLAELARLRPLLPAELQPPADLRAVTLADFPADVVEPLRERDGSVGKLVAVHPADGVDDGDGRAMARFAMAMRAAAPAGVHVTMSGSSLVFADILETNRSDGPVVTGAAAAGLVVMVLAVVGRNRRAVAVLAATGFGSLAMVAICALVGLRINFLDFVALPIALGLGVDYAINIAERVSRDDANHALRTTGGTVLVCSLTTVIGYASILFSANQAIRDFGLASLIGELTCVIAALTLVPALVRHSPR